MGMGPFDFDVIKDDFRDEDTIGIAAAGTT